MIAFIGLSALACVAMTSGLSRLERPARTPLLVFAGAYVLTTVIGATWIAWSNGGAFDAISGTGIDTSVVRGLGSPMYWFLLFLPLIAVGATAFVVMTPTRMPVFARLSKIAQFRVPATRRLDIASSVTVFSLGVAYCVGALWYRGRLGNFAQMGSIAGDYGTWIQMRSQMLDEMGSVYWGLVYAALPTLSFVVFYHAQRSKRWSLKLLMAGMAFTIVCLSVISFQKSIAMLYVVSLFMAYQVRRQSHFGVLVLAGLVTVGLLTLFQVYILQDWSVMMSIYHLVLRMGNAFPYYYAIFPRNVPFQGIDVEGTILGFHFLTPKTHYTVIAHEFMYPDTPVEGNVPIGAHMSAYAEGGVAWAITVSVFVSLLICGSCLLSRRSRASASAFAVYIQSLVAIYYSTQVAFREAVWSAYGMSFPVAAMAAFLVIRSSLTRPRNAAPLRASPWAGMTRADESPA